MSYQESRAREAWVNIVIVIILMAPVTSHFGWRIGMPICLGLAYLAEIFMATKYIAEKM
jgi:hypothetical protein